MLRLPSEFTHVRPLTFSVTSVPAASMRSSWAPRTRSMSVVLKRAQLAPRALGVGLVEEQRALDERLEVGEVHAGLLGAGLASARASSTSARCIVCSRSGWRARAARASRAGSIPASARVFSGAWMASCACAFLASA